MITRYSLFMLALVSAGAASAAEAPPATTAVAYTTLDESKLLDFRYSFPSLVGSHPELLSLVEKDRATNHDETLKDAKADSAMRSKNDYPFHAYEFWRDWTIDGQSDRLIALHSQTETFTGGAHGNQSSGLLLWDSKDKKTIEFAGLFAEPFWPVIDKQVCERLANERMRRAEMKSTDCPKPDELVFIPTDSDSNWSFDTIEVIADPYVAGSYAEGRYQLRLPVSETLIAAMKDEYRDSFEAYLPQ